MCDAVEKYGDKIQEKTKVNLVSSLMKSMKLSLDQALTALNIEGEERTLIAKQLKQ